MNLKWIYLSTAKHVGEVTNEFNIKRQLRTVKR